MRTPLTRSKPRLSGATIFGMSAGSASRSTSIVTTTSAPDGVVTMDVDLQADPAKIPKIVAPLRNGFDLVSSICNLNHHNPAMRRFASAAVTQLVAVMTGVKLRDVGCPFNAFTADVARSLSSFGELRRFLKPLAVRVASSVTEVEVSHRARAVHHGRTGYSATRLLRLFMDFFVNSISNLFAWLFAAAAASAVAGAIATSIAAVLWYRGALAPLPAAIIAGLTVLAVLTALVGLIGDYTQRIYRQSSGRPFYLVHRIHETTASVESRV